MQRQAPDPAQRAQQQRQEVKKKLEPPNENYAQKRRAAVAEVRGTDPIAGQGLVDEEALQAQYACRAIRE